MPLFSVTIEMRITVDIPVSAPSEEAAMEYVRGTDEWHHDGEVCRHSASPENIRPVSVRKIMHPSETDTPGDTECWGPEYYDENNEPYGSWTTAAVAFYGQPVMKGDTEEAGQEQHDEERRLEERFDLEKTAPSRGHGDSGGAGAA